MTQVAAGAKDWRKFVTVDPPASLSFQLFPEDARPLSWLSLINKSDQNIIFKVKTTKPMSYLVRPSQGIISPNSNSKVTVLFNHKLDSEEENKAILEDKFLVQLAPVASGNDLTEITEAKDKDTMAELNKLWAGVPKGNMVQFKLKVQKRKEQAAQIVGDSKGLGVSTTPGQDSNAQSSVFQSTKPGGDEQQKYDEFDRQKKRLQQLQETKRNEQNKLSSLQKLEDTKDFDANKKRAVGGASGKGKSESSGGYSLVHLLIVALLSLVIGAVMTKTTQLEDSALKQVEPVQVIEQEPEPVATKQEPEPVATKQEPEPVATKQEPEPVKVEPEVEAEPVKAESEIEAEPEVVADTPPVGEEVSQEL